MITQDLADRLARNRYSDVQIAMSISEAGPELISCMESIDETRPER